MNSNPPASGTYNATITGIRRIHADLAVFRVLPDIGPLEFSAGQYTVLGLGAWESRLEGCQPEPEEASQSGKLIRRAYSISCRLLDEAGHLVQATKSPLLDFYITLVRRAATPPALTPRLFALSEGHRLYCGPHAHGHYGLDRVRPGDDVVFAATGTGEAPHNAMLSELLSHGHQGRIICVTCVRYRRDLGYVAEHRELERRFEQYRYLPLTTRETENVDSTAPDYVGKRYLQDYFDSGEFERDAACRLDSQRMHVFLCGAPEMIGVPHRTHDPSLRYPRPRGMIEVLEGRGFQMDLSHAPGNIHFEKYW